MNTFKERSNHLKAIALMSIFTFIFPGIEYLFVDMISLLVSENRVVLSQNYVLGMSYLGFIIPYIIVILKDYLVKYVS